jgi:hypothetical protein
VTLLVWTLLAMQAGGLHVHLHAGESGHASDAELHVHSETLCSWSGCEEATIAASRPDPSRAPGAKDDLVPDDPETLALVLILIWLALARASIPVTRRPARRRQQTYLLAPPLRAPPA